MDSAYDYDPVWARAQELGVSIAFHSGFIGMTPYRSLSSYVFNHLSMLAEGQQSLAKSLFLGGVTRRFPDMNFVFLEGGVAWAAALYSDIVGHWEKRNLGALRANLDPALVDRALMLGDDRPLRARTLPGSIARLTARPAEPEDMLDEWAACGITEAEDIKALFADRFYFGCEADDPLTSMAFNTTVNPFGAELKAMMGSDIAHWDVPDVTEVLEEAWEMVEHRWIDEAGFEKFTFTNPARFYTGTNPALLQGHRGGGGRRPAAGRGLTMLDLLLPGARWSTAPGPRPWWPTSASATAGSWWSGESTSRQPGSIDVDRPGGVPGLRRPAHPLRRPAAVGPDGQPLGPPRGDHGARAGTAGSRWPRSEPATPPTSSG